MSWTDIAGVFLQKSKLIVGSRSIPPKEVRRTNQTALPSVISKTRRFAGGPSRTAACQDLL